MYLRSMRPRRVGEIDQHEYEGDEQGHPPGHDLGVDEERDEGDRGQEEGGQEEGQDEREETPRKADPEAGPRVANVPVGGELAQFGEGSEGHLVLDQGHFACGVRLIGI